MELYKKHRPDSFDGVVGNPATIKSLTKMLSTKKVPQVILFHGPPGCGKTTLARILATELGCAESDFFEKNSSDYRGIDSVRDLIRVSTLCARGSCKVFLLDEVHKMTNDAQNAILKLLEDTPPNTYILLCTTDPMKLIAAVRSRCCELEVQQLNRKLMGELVAKICAEERIKLDAKVMDLLIEKAGGSARRALVFLDRVRHLEPAEQFAALDADPCDSSPEVRELCQLLCFSGKWHQVAKVLKGLTEEPETVRYAVLGYAGAVMLNKPSQRLFEVISSFSKNFYDSKRAGLIGSCYEVLDAVDSV